LGIRDYVSKGILVVGETNVKTKELIQPTTRRKTRAAKKYDCSPREADVLEQDEPYNTGHVKDDIKKVS
jgi:hypothetical protein